MANSGFWTAGLEGTVDNLNATLFQKGAEADFDVTKTGLTFLETASGKIKRSNGTSWDVVVDVDPTAGAGGLRTLGVGAQQAAAGDHTHVPAHDAANKNTVLGATASDTINYTEISQATEAETSILSTTVTVVANTKMEVYCQILIKEQDPSMFLKRLYVDGVWLVQDGASYYTYQVSHPSYYTGQLAAGSRTVELRVYNNYASTRWFRYVGASVFGGSMKGA